jgi:hypothetical protein
MTKFTHCSMFAESWNSLIREDAVASLWHCKHSKQHMTTAMASFSPPPAHARTHTHTQNKTKAKLWEVRFSVGYVKRLHLVNQNWQRVSQMVSDYQSRLWVYKQTQSGDRQRSRVRAMRSKVMRQLPASKDVYTNAEESTALGNITKQWPVETQQMKINVCHTELWSVRELANVHD